MILRRIIPLVLLLGTVGGGCYVAPDRGWRDGWRDDGWRQRRWERRQDWRDYRQQRRWWWLRDRDRDHDHDDD